jgi:hypothetical protein
LGVPQGTFPSNDDIDLYYDEVDRALRTHGIPPRIARGRRTGK